MEEESVAVGADGNWKVAGKEQRRLGQGVWFREAAVARVSPAAPARFAALKFAESTGVAPAECLAMAAADWTGETSRRRRQRPVT